MRQFRAKEKFEQQKKEKGKERETHYIHIMVRDKIPLKFK